MRNPILKTSSGIRESLSNLWFRNECSIVEIEDIVEDSTNGTELVNGLNSLKLFRKFTLDRETDNKVRLKSVDSLGNVSYFEATKEQVKQRIKTMKYSEMVKFLNEHGINAIQPIIASEVSAQLEKSIDDDEFENVCHKIYGTYLDYAVEPDIWTLVDEELIKRGYKE